jgi:hypothetical protein
MKTNLIDFKPINNSLAQKRPDLFRKPETVVDPAGQQHLPLRDGGDAYILNEELTRCVNLVYAKQHQYSYEQARFLFAKMAQICSAQGVDDNLCEEWFQYNCQRWTIVA